MAPKKSTPQPSADEQAAGTSTAPSEETPEFDASEIVPEEAPVSEVSQVYRAQFLEDWRYHHGAAYSDLPKGHIISSNEYDFRKLVMMKAPLALLDEDGDQIQVLSPDDFAE